MSAPIYQQIDALRILAQRMSPRQLMKAGSIARESEAVHLINMIKDAKETLEAIERGDFAE